MKKKVAILGSTGSIGKSLIRIIKKNSNNFDVILLTANKNYKELLKQTKILNVKNVIINNKLSFQKFKKNNKNKNLKIFNNFEKFNEIFKSKIDYSMSSIVGLEGLEPTIKIIRFTKTIAIANKESIICGWNLIEKNLKKYRTNFIPVDSEHFSIWYGLKENKNLVDKIFLTASGGPFINYPFNKFKKIKVNQALKHPNWKMGKKITIDSATMMNKVFEVIEAKKIFSIKYKQLFILTHPQSYLHAIVKFKNGLIKLIAHNTDMRIPIFNTLYNSNKNLNFINTKLEIIKLNDLNLKELNIKKFPSVKILKMLPQKNSLFETVLVSANDELVKQFLNKKIKFTDISLKLINFLKRAEFVKFKKKTPIKIKDIMKLNDYVRFKIHSKHI